VEQNYRDMRIHPIHEGTTGIQGMDLLGRKIRMEDGKAYHLYIEAIRETITACGDEADLDGRGRQLEEALTRLDQVTQHLITGMPAVGTEVFLADATLYLEFFGIITIAWQWLLQALTAKRALAGKTSRSQTSFYQGKLYTCAYFFSYELPKIKGLADRLLDDNPVTVEMIPEYFND
jgi:butyryl-CoA dehydrogenase